MNSILRYPYARIHIAEVTVSNTLCHGVLSVCFLFACCETQASGSIRLFNVHQASIEALHTEIDNRVQSRFVETRQNSTGEQSDSFGSHVLDSSDGLAHADAGPGESSRDVSAAQVLHGFGRTSWGLSVSNDGDAKSAASILSVSRKSPGDIPADDPIRAGIDRGISESFGNPFRSAEPDSAALVASIGAKGDEPPDPVIETGLGKEPVGRLRAPSVLPEKDLKTNPDEKFMMSPDKDQKRSGLCVSNKASVENLHIRKAGPVYLDVLAAMDFPALSPAVVDDDDLVIERDDLINPDKMRIVVRKPTSAGLVFAIDKLPDDPVEAFKAIHQHFDRARDAGASKIVFPKNAVVRLSNPTISAAHMNIEDFADTVIDFNGSTVEFINVAPGLVISNSQRVLIKNAIFRNKHLLSSIAVVESDPDSSAGIQFTLLPEFVSSLEEQFSTTGNKPQLITVGKAKKRGNVWVFDARDNFDLFTNRGGNRNVYTYKTSTTGNVRKAYFGAAAKGVFDDVPYAPGQLVYLLHQNNNGSGVILKNTDADVEDISFENVEFRNIPGMGIFGEFNRGIHLNDVRIVPDPDNPLSFWGSSSDAFHINNNGGDIVVENSFFGGSADDLFTAKGNWWRVSQIDRDTNTVVVENADRSYGVHLWAAPGERLILIGDELELLGHTRHARLSKKLNSKRHEIYLDKIPAGLKVGVLVANPDRAGGRILIRDNQFGNSRAQGVLAQAQNIVVENNRFFNIAGPAIKINFSLADWHEGVSVGNILLKNNMFEDTALGVTKPPYSIYVQQLNAKLEDIPIIHDVRISGNAYQDTRGSIACD